MNGKKAEDAIIVSPNSSNEAKVTATDPDGDALTYDWMIMKEKTASSDGSLPDGITGLIDDNTKKEITFKAPSTVGNYRLIVICARCEKQESSKCGLFHFQFNKKIIDYETIKI